MSSALVVSLQKHLEDKIVAERERHDLQIATLRELIGARDKALELQAKEYDRRLDDLNHAHARAELERRLTVRSDTYETFIDQDRAWKRVVDHALSTTAARREVTAALWVGGLSLVAAVVAIAGLVIR